MINAIFSYIPLHIATILGFATSAISFILILVEIGLYLIYGRVVPGFTTTIIIMLFLFGVLFSLLGIMGIYVARIYDEVKERPNFIVRQEVGFEKNSIGDPLIAIRPRRSNALQQIPQECCIPPQ